MTNTLTKEEMHDRLANVLEERGISPYRTELGQNIICRVGDPTNVHDLIRVGAHRAAAILVMLTDQDNEEEDYSEGSIHNGATLRCALALRHVIFGNSYQNLGLHPDLRIVLQMTSPSSYVNAVCFQNDWNNDVILPLDLSLFLNSLMFFCATQPGLASVLMEIIDFEGTAIRRRWAKYLRSGVSNAYGDCVGKKFKDVRKQFKKAIFIVIVRPSAQTREENIKAKLGICPDPDTIIEENDLLIFIGPRSNPKHDIKMVDTMNGYLSTARNLMEQYNPQGKKDQDTLTHVLICGWRPVWEESSERFRRRVVDLMTHRSHGSTITLLNGVEKDRFVSLMTDIGFIQGENEVAEEYEGFEKFEMFVKNDDDDLANYTFSHPDYPHVTVTHVYGDATLPHVLGPVVLSKEINTAIVLGTQASVRLNAHSRDTRVLTIMLQLRQIINLKIAEFGHATHMHIVGENQEDLTAKLALAPRVDPNSSTNTSQEMSPPDFINSQAIYARAMTQTLAYPLIATAVATLFSEDTETGNIEIISAFSYVPQEIFGMPKYFDGISYGIIRACVLEAAGEVSICIGYIQDGNINLTPDHDKLVKLTGRCKLVVIRKVQKK